MNWGNHQGNEMGIEIGLKERNGTDNQDFIRFPEGNGPSSGLVHFARRRPH